MLSFDIRSLEVQAAVVDDELKASDPVWQDGDPLPVGAIHVTGRLSAAGGAGGRFYWHGRVEGEVSMPCRRCLNDAGAHVEDEIHLIFADQGDEETDDPDVYRLDPRARELDLRPAIREQWVLAAPSFVLCRDDCKGLCPRCGSDLNASACECPPQTDSRWDDLRKATHS
jgi:uncharacterized protein